MKVVSFCSGFSRKRLFAHDRAVTLNAGVGSPATAEHAVKLREKFANEGAP